MNAKLRKKTRETVEKIHADMQTDPTLRKAVKENPVRVLADRGLDLKEIIRVYDTGWRGWCPGGSPTLA
jgi:hypothetical protein